MEQPSVGGSKRRPSMLSLQPSKLNPPQHITKHRDADLPRTPYPLPSKGGKRSVSFSEQDGFPWEGEVKKQKIAREGGIPSTPPYRDNFPSLESRYPPASQYRIISLVQLMKAWDSILDQIDWSKVVQEAGGRGRPDTYRYVFKTIVHSHIKELMKQEHDGKDMRIELSKRDDEVADIDTGNDSSEDGDGDGFRHLMDNTFLESDERGNRSEDYTDDETDNEEDSDEEDQGDDDTEVIDDWVSV